MKKHNGVIGFWKFVFCIIILIFHVGIEQKYYKIGTILFRYGSIGVEFFFLVTGYLFAKGVVKELKEDKSKNSIGKDTFNFILKKLKTLFPYILVAFIIDFILQIIIGKMSTKQYIFTIFDVTLLSMFGFKRKTALIGQSWYISTMLISMALLYPQIKKYKENYFYLIAPLTILFVSGILFHYSNSLRTPEMWLGFTYKGTIRGYLEICIGTVIYSVTQKFKQINFNNLGKILLTLIELFGFVSTILMSNFYPNTSYDYILLILLSVSILIAFSEKTIEFNLFNNKIFYFLERLSLPIYLLHHPIIKFFDNYTSNYYIELICVIVITLVLSYITVLLIDYLKSKDYYIPKLKSYIIKEC